MSDYIVLTDCTTITNNRCLKCRKLGGWDFVPIGLRHIQLWDPDDANPLVSALLTSFWVPTGPNRQSDTVAQTLANFHYQITQVTLRTNVTGPRSLHLLLGHWLHLRKIFD